MGERVPSPYDGDVLGLGHPIGANLGCSRAVRVRGEVDLAAPQLGVSILDSAMKRRRTPGARSRTAARRAGP